MTGKLIWEQASSAFGEIYGSPPEMIVRAPGRVNLIGEHTDYNAGLALPMAIDRAIWIALRSRKDITVQLHSLDFATPAEFSLDQINHTNGWEEYIRGTAWALKASSLALRGWEGVLASDIPLASGLSSSAAVELAVARAFWALARWKWDGVQMAQVAKTMENKWLGLKSGIMDQLISACGEEDQALLIDFRSLDFKPVPLPEGVMVVVMNTAVRRGLVDSAYNQRVEECQQVCDHFQVSSLRELTLEELYAEAGQLSEIVVHRARHVLTENARTLKAAEAMQKGDAILLGQLMNESHASLRDDYEVSCRELDTMVELALAQLGCLGARMTGAGFGGSAISLVKGDHVDGFIQQVSSQYKSYFDIDPVLFSCQAAGGASLYLDQ